MTQTRMDEPKLSHGRAVSQTPLPADTSNEAQLELAALLAKSDTRDELYQQLVVWLQKRANCAAAGFYTQDGDDVVEGPNYFDGPVFDNDQFLHSAKTSARLTSRHGSRQTCSVERVRNLKVVSVPVQTNSRQFDALTAAMVVSNSGSVDDGLLVTVAAHAALWHANQQHATTRRHLELTAAAMGLITAIQSAESFRASCITLVNNLRTHLNCRAVVLGLVRRAGGRCRISAMSGMADFDSNAAFTLSVEDALEECIVRGRLSVFPAKDPSNRDALLSHQKLTGDLQAARIVSHPLKNSADEVVGAWLVIDDTATAASDETEPLLRSAATPVANTLQIAERVDRAFFSNRSRRGSAWQWLVRGVCAAAVITAVLLLQVPYRVHCECAAEPDVRRFIVAPHEGLVEKTFVEPGDVVQQGQLLARMDGRDVRWELAGLVAEQEQAKKDHDAGLLSGDIAASQRATLELKQLEARREILTRRRNELELQAPISGIVLDGHLERVENAPVTIGQALYEVAPLTPVTVEVAIPDDEHPNVETGFEVVVRFDGLDSDFTGTIQRIQPRSEIRDGDNVFIAEVVIENDDERLRPGMSGYARVHGRSRSLGWNLFHKPWEHLRKHLPF